jgi:hypothetical protein
MSSCAAAHTGLLISKKGSNSSEYTYPKKRISERQLIYEHGRRRLKAELSSAPQNLSPNLAKMNVKVL